MTNAQVLLEYKFKVGDILKYQSGIESKQETTQRGAVNALQSKLEMNLRQQVVDFLNDTYKLEIFIESGTLTQNNTTQNLPAVEKSNFTSFKKNGEVIAAEGQGQFTQQAFPLNSINIGDSWVSDAKLNFPGRLEPVIIHYNYIFEKTELLSGFECAYIKVECPSTKIELQPGVTQDFEAGGFVYFAHNEGLLVKSSLKTVSKLTSAQIQISAENIMSMTLLERNGKKAE